jgi:hypothetical protein
MPGFYRRADALIADAPLNLCLNGQLYRRADALIADAALKVHPKSSCGKVRVIPVPSVWPRIGARSESICVNPCLSLLIRGKFFR